MLKAINFDVAQQRFIQTFAPIATSLTVPLSQSIGRVLVSPVHARLDQPPTDRSAMDGYAIRRADVAPGVALRIQQRCYAGNKPLPLASGYATRIFTGSLIPLGADTVVMQEDAQENDGYVKFEMLVRASTHIRRQGEEVRAGQILMDAGVHIQPTHVALAAAQGIDMLDVFPLLRVGILTTGNELVHPGEYREAQQIFNSNASMLTALVKGMGATVMDAIHTSDDEREIGLALHNLRINCDLILSTGGASVGEKDLVRTVLTSLGATNVVSGVNMKPGKPVALARYNQAPVVVLPGNPGAAFATFVLLATPLIRRLQGRANCLPVVPNLPVDFETGPDDARDRFLRIRFDTSGEGMPALHVLAQQGANNLQTLTETSGLIRLPVGQPISRGNTVPYYDFAHWLA